MVENQEDCYMRLPCGICRLTMTDCPKVSHTYSNLQSTLTPAIRTSTNFKEDKDDGSV